MCVKPTLLKTPTRLGIVTPTFSACTVFLKLLGDVANRTATISMRRRCRERGVKFLKVMGGRFLRMDTLALLLSLANVGANAEVLVLDMLGGLLTAAVAERLGGMQCIRTSSV